MDFMEGVLLLGIVGGAVMALVTFGVRHVSPRPPALIQMPPEPLSTDLINMAHIRVVGIGGLGLLIVTLMMAFVLPELAAALFASVALGILFAGGLVVWRRSHARLDSDDSGLPPALLDMKPRRTLDDPARPGRRVRVVIAPAR